MKAATLRIVQAVSFSLLLGVGGQAARAQVAAPQNPPAQIALPNADITPIPLNPPSLGPQIILPTTGPEALVHSMSASPTLNQVDPQFAVRPLHLLDAVGVALAVNPQLAQAGQNVLFFEGTVGEAQSARIPTLSLSPGETFIHHIAAEAYGIQATIPIDISQLLSVAVRQAQFEQVAARLDVNRIRNEVVYGVDQAFFDELRAQALVKVSVTNLQDSLDRLRDAKVRYHAEAVAYIDVLRAQTDVANAEKQLIQSQSDVNRALARLSVAMGVDPNSKYSVSSEGSVVIPPGVAGPTQAPQQPDVNAPNPGALVPAPPPSSIHVEPVAPSAGVESEQIAKASELGPEYQQVLTESLRTRPEVWESDARIAAARAGITLARRSELPSMEIGVGYFDERSVTGTHYNEPQAIVGFTIPIFDAGLAQSRLKEARALADQEVISKRQVVDTVTVDVQSAYFNLVQARSQVAVANQALAQAEAAFDLARIRYNTGVSSRPGISPIIEVSDAQVALTLAEENQVNALYDYNVAKAQLDRSIGRFAFVLNGASGFKQAPDPKMVGIDH